MMSSNGNTAGFPKKIWRTVTYRLWKKVHCSGLGITCWHLICYNYRYHKLHPSSVCVVTCAFQVVPEFETDPKQLPDLGFGFLSWSNLGTRPQDVAFAAGLFWVTSPWKREQCFGAFTWHNVRLRDYFMFDRDKPLASVYTCAFVCVCIHVWACIYFT